MSRAVVYCEERVVVRLRRAQDGDLGDLTDEAFEEVGMFVVLAEVEELHVAHDQAPHEGCQMARAAQSFN